MKNLVIALLVGVGSILLWRALSGTVDQSAAMNRLYAAINTSSLPERARQEMQTLLDQRRLRPSQYLDASH
jgi:hypothetical protein